MFDDTDSVLCACSGTTVGQLQALIEQGIRDSERLSRITGACSGCGGCEYELQQLIARAVAPS
jgi:bacterioferritin-associated ferredoxin